MVRVDHGVAGRAVFGDADVENLGLLAAQLVEEALDHLGRLGDALTRVRDAGLPDPLLKVLDVLVDVLVDVGDDLRVAVIGRGVGFSPAARGEGVVVDEQHQIAPGLGNAAIARP